MRSSSSNSLMSSGRSSGLACLTFTWRSPLLSSSLDHRGGTSHRYRVRRYMPFHDCLRTDHGAFSDDRTPQDRGLLADPAVGVDPDGGRHDPLVLDPHVGLLVAVVEVGHV